MATLQLIDLNNDKYYYQVNGKRPIRPRCRVVKDIPFLPTEEKEGKYDVIWAFGTFGGKTTMEVNHQTTVLDILKAIQPQAFIFSDQTVVSYIAVYTDANYISIRLSQVGTI